MAEICGIGWVAEWFKAAVLKTAVTRPTRPLDSPCKPQKSAIHGCRNCRSLGEFAHRRPSHMSAQSVYEVFHA